MNNSGYRYGFSNMVRNFNCVKTAALWAGGFGLLQSIAWMALTIVGIIAYNNCILLATGQLTFGNVIAYAFDNLYFRGNCEQPTYNLDIQKSLETIFTPVDILIWNCAYLGVAFCWLISSGILLIYVKKDNAKLTASVLLSWAFVTLCICLMDLALGITFGIDYSNFYARAYNYNLQTSYGAINSDGAQVIAAAVASLSLMIISFKGFVLWIINFVLMIYLIVLTSRILRDKDSSETLFMPRKDSDDILTTRPPINAFQEEKTVVTAFTNEAYVPDNRSMNAIELNEEPLQRAARMSTDVSLQDRRFRNLDAFQQYPPPRYNSLNNNNNNNNNLANNKNRLGSTKEEEIIVTTATTSGFPAPDYTPPMSRANQNSTQNGGISRNQRY